MYWANPLLTTALSTFLFQLQPGVLDLFQFLGERDIKRALMTRNAWVPTNAFLKRLREELEASKDKYPSLNSEELFSMVRRWLHGGFV